MRLSLCYIGYSLLAVLLFMDRSHGFTLGGQCVVSPRQAMRLSSTRLREANDKKEDGGGGGGFFGNFMEEFDAFIDDAMARRLGNGAAFYGKRRSNFYGRNDSMKKVNRSVPDPTEDYQGPSSSGFFKWMPDEEGQLRPVSRLKEKNLERSPEFWDRVYGKKKDQ